MSCQSVGKTRKHNFLFIQILLKKPDRNLAFPNVYPANIFSLQIFKVDLNVRHKQQANLILNQPNEEFKSVNDIQTQSATIIFGGRGVQGLKNPVLLGFGNSFAVILKGNLEISPSNRRECLGNLAPVDWLHLGSECESSS